MYLLPPSSPSAPTLTELLCRLPLSTNSQGSPIGLHIPEIIDTIGLHYEKKVLSWVTRPSFFWYGSDFFFRKKKTI